MAQPTSHSDRHWHFIGIGGIGMSALAEYLLLKGNRVTGSDITENERFDRLRQLGAEISIPHGDQLPPGVDLVVRTAAVKAENRELQHALELELPLLKRAELLGIISSGLRTIAVAGTHGKTGTAALLAEALATLDASPTAFIGGVMRCVDSNLMTGEGELCVCEADEYDRSFLQLHPAVALITSLDHDHTDIYPDQAALEEAVTQFCRQSELIVHHDDQIINPLVEKSGKPALLLGTDGPLEFLSLSERTGKQWLTYRLGDDQRQFELPLAGRHQAENALLVLAVLQELGYAAPAAEKAVSSFSGVTRRMDTLMEDRRGTLMDDYAHHPVEISAVLAALPSPAHVIFQSHTYTRTRDFAEGFAGALAVAASVYILPVFPAREAPLSGIDEQLLAGLMMKAGYGPVACGVDPLHHLQEHFRPGDTIITLGAGDIWKLHPQLLEFLRSQPEAEVRS